MLLGVLLFFISKKPSKKKIKPSISFSLLKALEIPDYKGRARLIWLPERLYQIALFLFALALLDPRLEKTGEIKKSGRFIPTKGVGIYLALDQSGSMADRMSPKSPSKMEIMKEVTEKFISERPDDLIGIVTFARKAQVVSPLTLDHETLIREVKHLDVVKNPDEDGTAMGYAIYKTAHLIAATKQQTRLESGYEIKGAIIILVTDGFQDPNPLDQGSRLRTMGPEEAADYAKKEQIRLYLINVDPMVAGQEFSSHRKLLRQMAEKTGGRFYQVVGGNSLEDIYADINRLETSDWNVAKEETYSSRLFSFYPYLIILGLLTLLMGFCLETTYFRKIP